MKLWLRIDADYPRDPRVGRLADELEISLDEALGKVLRAHCSMAEHAPDGDLSAIADSTINGWVGWPTVAPRRGSTRSFAHVFRKVFTDDGVDTSYSYQQGKLMERAEKNRDRVRLWRERQKKTVTETPPTALQNANRTETRSVSQEYAATERNVTKNNKLPRAADAAPDRFEEFWAVYPRRSGTNPKSGAETQWRRRIREGITPDTMIAGAQRYRDLMETTGKVGSEYVMQAVRFLGKDKHFEDDHSPPAAVNGDHRPAASASEGRTLSASERMVW